MSNIKSYATGAIFSHNLWSKAPQSIAQSSTDPTYPSYSTPNIADYFAKTTGWNNLVGATLSEDDFRLLSTATYAINKGTNLGSPYNIDYFGTTRPQGTAWDIGAIEYTSTTTTPNCSEGQITSTCLCAGTSYSTGYCCLGIYQLTACSLPSTNPIAYWKLDEGIGNVANDEIGNYDGTITGAAWSTDSVSGTSLNFDSSGEIVNMGDRQILTNDFTISTWVKSTNFSTVNGYAVSKYSTLNNGREYAVYFNGQGDMISLIIGSSDGSTYTTIEMRNSSIILNNNEWNHVVLTRSGSSATGFVNGEEEILTDTITANNFADTNSNLQIGDRTDGGRQFIGRIDEVKIYNRVLTSSEVLDLFNEFNSQSSCGDADTDDNSSVSITELINYISSWKSGSVSITQLIKAISEWKSGC